MVLTGLEPNTTYEVRVAAVNGKGQGEFSHTEAFQTLPIRKKLNALLIHLLINSVDADIQQVGKPQIKHLYLYLYKKNNGV